MGMKVTKAFSTGLPSRVTLPDTWNKFGLPPHPEKLAVKTDAINNAKIPEKHCFDVVIDRKILSLK